MATGLSSYLANKFLDAVGNATAYSAANVFVKLHIGDPGANGTGNPATETTRQSASFGATFFTAWDSATTGNFLFSGSITGNSYTAGDTFTIPSGSLTVSLTLAS